MKKAASDELYRIPAEYRDPKHPKHKAAMKLANTGKAIWSDQYELVQSQEKVANHLIKARSAKYMARGGVPQKMKSTREMRRAQQRAQRKKVIKMIKIGK